MVKPHRREKGKRRRKEKSDAPLTEPIAALIIVLALLLSMAVSALGGWEAQNAAKHAAQQALSGAISAASQGPFANFVQLSDPLLVLVGPQTPLPSDWQMTPRMVDDELVDLRMYEDYTAMCRAAAKDDVWFWVASGYRSVEEQQEVLDRAIKENKKAGLPESAARTEALRTITPPGHSEHHTGLAIDLNDVDPAFAQTKAYQWLQAHSAEYGFVQRYRQEKTAITGIDEECWHYRYVGPAHAKEMSRLGLCLEEYVVYLQKQGVK